jgi:hypothetical protein
MPVSVLALLVLSAGTAGAGAWALRPSPDQAFTTIVFRAGLDAQRVLEAVASLDGRLVWADTAAGVVVVDVAPAERWRFYAKGALLVSGAGLPAGCVGWSKA